MFKLDLEEQVRVFTSGEDGANVGDTLESRIKRDGGTALGCEETSCSTSAVP